MPLEVLWIASGVGWGLALGYIFGHRSALAQAPEEMRALKRDVEDELDKLAHRQDRARKRVAAAAAVEQLPADGQADISEDHRADLRRRAAAFFGPRRQGIVNGGGSP